MTKDPKAIADEIRNQVNKLNAMVDDAAHLGLIVDYTMLERRPLYQSDRTTMLSVSITRKV